MGVSTDTLSKGQRTRLRLLEVAVRRFAADGYRRTAVSDIARDAGLTPAAAYAYFPSKEALFKAAVDEDAAALIDRAAAGDGPGPALAGWLLVPGRLRALLPEHPLARRVLAAQEPEVIPQLLELPSLVRLREQLRTDIAAAQRTGAARTDIDAAEIALGLETVVLALLMAGVHVPPDAGRDAGVLAVLDAVLRAP